MEVAKTGKKTKKPSLLENLHVGKFYALWKEKENIGKRLRVQRRSAFLDGAVREGFFSGK